MHIRTKLFLIFMSIAFAFVAAVVYESVLAHERAVSKSFLIKAEVTADLIANVSLRHMDASDPLSMKKSLSSATRLRHIGYLQVSDNEGRPIFTHVNPGVKFSGGRINVPGRMVEDGIFGIKKDLINNNRPYGTLELGIHVDSSGSEMENVLWRALFQGVVFLGVLAAVLWAASSRLAKDIRMLVSAAGKMKDTEMPSLPAVAKGSEMGQLSAAFKGFHDTIAEEKNLRKETETLNHDFFAMTVHDLKQPITVLKAVNELMLEAITGRAYGKKEMDRISYLANDSLRRLNGMVEDILNISKLSCNDIPVQKERIMLESLIKESAEENSATVGASGRKWSVEIMPGIKDYCIYCDDVLIRRVIGNLVLNAIHYTPEGGEITLGVRPQAKGSVELFVRDTGVGIPEKFREEIFKKYASLSKTAKNVGLGLAFCKLVADRHGAGINVRSEQGKGTEISIVLPISTPEIVPLPGNPAHDTL
ncbi:MAG: hypothetical protein A2234_10475 [Elusimicrobia bacterium RIFOXYA2_FULL_58_8]|nr:MAG: hypothetical protein A2285_09630 [Elusimicrobia bacterium RIFOXYA12_FULL_57_11]OGS14841.1 MAG: hypothetical protein A2234_10475 [Elusimicrobia bacterium RIFOXYA2_FULL_58_8]